MGNDIKSLGHPDHLHLAAAQGWLELGLHREANEELEQITPAHGTHPEVLEVRWQINASQKKWIDCVEIAETLIRLIPEEVLPWIHLSYGLHELKKTTEAKANLMSVADKFPKVMTIPYNLACYCSQLHQFEEAKMWFKKAMAIDEKDAKAIALEDPDLKPLWDSLGGTLWGKNP